MNLFTSERFDDLKDLYIDQLRDLYDAENRILDALPKMIDKASAADLKAAFRDHLEETRQHVARLEQVFADIGLSPKRESCQAMKGIIQEGEEIVKAKGDDHVRDAALVAAAQRVEHYEMAGYGSVRNFALRLGHEQAARILQTTLDEEGKADHRLTQIAESHVNRDAAHRAA